MPNTLSLPIWTVNLEFSENISLVSPLLIPETIAINESNKQLAKTLIQRLEASQDDLSQDIFKYTPQISLKKKQLNLSIKILDLTFDYFYTQLANNSYLGFVPVLGVEGYAKTTTELVEALKAAIELEFSRKKRHKNIKDIITTIWYENIEFTEHFIDTNVSKPAENKKKQTKWLPKIANKLETSKSCRCFGRDTELEQMQRALTGKYSRSLLLVGRSGVGKTALVKELYRQGIDSVVWETTAARLLQKLTVDSGWEEPMGQLLEELSESGDILYVHNLAQLFEVGAYVGNPISMAEFMREQLALASVRMMSECTDEELARIETTSLGYTNLFNIQRIEAPTFKQQLAIIHSLLKIPKPIIEETLRLQHRYSLYSGFPGKTISFLENIHTKQITREMVVTRFCNESGMPRFLIDSHTPLKLDTTREFFQSRLFGQNAAIDILVNLLAAVKTRLTRPGKPIASLLFVGPTGVGKTELVKALAEFMFGDSERLIRFDMSEFSDEVAVLRLTGDVGAQGLLTNKLRQQPFSVVLFDELEKAHYSFYDLLLQIMGEGRLTDAKGQVADFCSSVIIMTSNIGAGHSRQLSPGFHNISNSGDELQKHYLHAVQKFFRPELFNRIDQIIPFNSLNLKVLHPIVKRELDKILARYGLMTRNISIEFEDAVINYLANLSSNSPYGARQLQRNLQEKVVIPLAKTLNRYSISTSMKIVITIKNNQLEFNSNIFTEKRDLDKTLPELVTQVTAARRLAQQINDGAIMNKLWSRWDILERNRNCKQFWQTNANEYAKLHQLLEQNKTLFKQIQTIETETTLALIAIKKFNNQLTTSFTDWQQANKKWQLELLDTIQVKTGRCLLAIYGKYENIEKIYNIFINLIADYSWNINQRAVWIQAKDQKYIYTDNLYRSYNSHDKLVGYELEIIGAGAGLFFSKESGIHVWRDHNHKPYKYAILTAETKLNKFQTPIGIHRKQFSEGMQVKREYSKNGFFDPITKFTSNRSNWQSILEQQLNEQFEESLRKVLLGSV
ncbi:AAA family ATPase [Candidatus Marithrix sp. Canyon 246]|uniref:AAA family ATPase n=1 Tax=Candidatus Marithrix sp. Canyon 246 TaxID=1827136 RepID=UPI000849FFCF|nr:AAA family ATPase [Candidatus Marithrix sp. Canyon 246]